MFNQLAVCGKLWDRNLMEGSDLNLDPCFKVKMCLFTKNILYLPQKFGFRCNYSKTGVHMPFKFWYVDIYG